MKLGIQYLLYKVSASISGAIADSRISNLIGDIGTAFAMTLGLVGASAVMLFIAIISMVKAVTV